MENSGVNELLEHAKWMDGAVWAILMIALWSAYEFSYLGAPVTPAKAIQIIVVWGLAGAGYAILSGWFSRRGEQKKE